MPGYLHLVPSGQTPQVPVDIFGSTSFPCEAFEDEADDEYEKETPALLNRTQILG